ncbi:hypothetical protein LEP1GSC191_0929 [Leptospira borgpetersenii serovar Mini str. 201000851]|uniref:Uncharacterized protein n=2 Tax=Leptospira borgpetersenii TaxID=174 RepID=M3HRB3_LEPBO|nr:hypothetical protein LEP1GSC128_0386 [Leptospira borgpetersenii str. 200801926]EMG00591.1 hypothetical protein LEP1GSC123_1333 [Leptospira borgpetersenii str. 200701203]ENO64398.1 hypothetical protein LEP1GSC191_0929 [Leptospira borgpetersenii serovar Mini str. 201000851]
MILVTDCIFNGKKGNYLETEISDTENQTKSDKYQMNRMCLR